MPQAHSRHIKYAYRDHDTDHLLQAPIVQNTWYEVFHAYDVRLLWCILVQDSDEDLVETVEVRWTIDGIVYVGRLTNMPFDTEYWWYRGHRDSTDLLLALRATNTPINAGYYVDKRGLDFKVEVRQTSGVGTNPFLECWCVRETLIET